MSDVTVARAREVTAGVDWLVVEVSFEDGGLPAHFQLFWDGERDVADRPEVVRWLLPDLERTSPVTVLGGEQSNTSLVVGDDVIVKVFRRLTAERNPDVEVVRRLWEVGFRSVPEPLAESARRIDVESLVGTGAAASSGIDVDLAVARRFLRGAVDGWALATGEPSRFLSGAAELGQVTADMHLAMARAFGAEPGDGDRWAAAMATQLDRAGGLEAAGAARARYQALATCPAPGRALRIHGDYHLGQVLRRDDAWYVLDFEGEPARPIAERIAPTSPLKDVAGMLRSFGYAAVVADAPPGWEGAARQAFLDGYLGAGGIADLLPGDVDLVLHCFELDKAVYEVAYERSHRPTWAHIPLGAVQRLLGP